ncbi:CRISPR-associated endoribonuclease Cas6 [Fulvivirgaceae bacterium BMA10]|uniref:CRISPR-associated endoribonuclease Cas6 n=1 Tax=Splendidivirga corallicola TaxID=3051826 RepID=A0ABT8KSF1_9BACT|nr:CRISPR-associated endoribonuclease Cas6 [Fulvivirgaceae bacterium BMA10]
MRVRIIFTLKNKGASVPFHHQYLLAQMVKGMLVKGGNEKYSNFSYYNFSALKGQTKISRSGLHFYSNKVTLVFSSPDKAFNDYFLSQLFEFPKVEIGNLILTPEHVEKECVPDFSEVTKFICISPLVLLNPTYQDDSNKKFISPDEDLFSDLLYDSLMNRMEKYGKFSSEEISSFYKFQLVPDKDYIRRIKEQQKKFARIYPVYDQDVKYEVRGYTLPFQLYADPKVQEFVFTSGLGVFTSKGFGMIDLANINPVQRTEVYEVFKLSQSH